VQDRPTAQELMEAVAEWLRGELAGVVPEDRRYEVLIAAHLCEVVAREARDGLAFGLEDVRLFRTLLGETGEDPPADAVAGEARELATRLAARIRAGEHDADFAAVGEALRGHVLRKLQIARPGYADG